MDQYFQTPKKDLKKCLKDLYSKVQNCSEICTTLNYPYPDLPNCQSPKQFSCIGNQIWDLEEYFDCYRTDIVTSYSIHDRIENPFHFVKNDFKTDIFIGIFTMNKVIKEEVFVLTLQDLIGSVGGSLGMFFGFSISTSIFYCLNKIWNKI